MTTMSRVDFAFDRVRNVHDKLRWGVKAVGVGATLRGAGRLGSLLLRRPRHSEVRLRCGPVLEFGFPEQVPYALLMFGDLIDPEYSFLRRVARPGWIVADVGAAIGQFTTFAATLPCSAIHAFEPSAANIEALQQNIARNSVSHIAHVHPIALSNVEGEARFGTAAKTWVSGLSANGEEIVPVRTLTAEFERLGLTHVSVLKINVAGFEPGVIEGGERFLANGGADILVLLLGLPSLPWYAKLAEYGYRFFYFHPGQNTLFEVTAFDPASVLDHRPWPARHILAVHQRAIDAYVGPILPIRALSAFQP
jgi:FkbM family methyltransferase